MKCPLLSVALYFFECPSLISGHFLSTFLSLFPITAHITFILASISNIHLTNMQRSFFCLFVCFAWFFSRGEITKKWKQIKKKPQVPFKWISSKDTNYTFIRCYTSDHLKEKLGEKVFSPST